jgi:hypothetical protein
VVESYLPNDRADHPFPQLRIIAARADLARQTMDTLGGAHAFAHQSGLLLGAV